jgi:hypothetical protein
MTRILRSPSFSSRLYIELGEKQAGHTKIIGYRDVLAVSARHYSPVEIGLGDILSMIAMIQLSLYLHAETQLKDRPVVPILKNYKYLSMVTVVGNGWTVNAFCTV